MNVVEDSDISELCFHPVTAASCEEGEQQPPAWVVAPKARTQRFPGERVGEGASFQAAGGAM